MLENSTIKEHYIKIQELYNNAVNILTAINQSFQTTSSEITVSFLDTDNLYHTIRIPSFLYMENRIEQLDTNFTSLFNMPKSGEAWFTKSADMYKLEMVKSNNGPVKPEFHDQTLYAQAKTSNIFKDLVNPKTYLRLPIDNLPDNIEKMLIKKIIFHDTDSFNFIYNSSLKTIDEFNTLIYDLEEGRDYDIYDTVVDLPIKEDQYKSEFRILDIPQTTTDNPYIETSTNNLIYRLILDTFSYTKEEDSSIEYTLQPGQYLTLDNEYVIYKILEVNTITNGTLQYEIILEEVNGHIGLQTYFENTQMILHLYNQDYSRFHYVEVPLEEDPHVVFFFAALYNNTKSMFSDALIVDLNSIKMVDKNGNKIMDNGKEISYIEYYNKYCQNVGDLLLGISQSAYPQISNYTVAQLNEMQNGDIMQSYASMTINTDILKVQRINKHLIDDEYTNKVIQLHAKRNELNLEIDNIQTNINDIYNQLVNTDFSMDNNITQLSLKSKLDDLYVNKASLQKQLISIVDNINATKVNLYGTKDAKYRIRGNASVELLEEFLRNTYPGNCNVIQMEVQYKYKSVGSDTTNVQNINSNLFTDWNKLNTIERERKLVFDETSSSYKIEYENYSDYTNIIKWNQIEIPITQGEDVVIRVRYKYTVGQPFINIYTPWSSELVIKFPSEFTDYAEISDILEQNEDDEITARFDKTLLNDGYTEHINNKLIDGQQKFYHMPENIYSGFNTSENNLISLKDKLQSMANDIDKYKVIIESDMDSKYEVHLTFDSEDFELFPNYDNKITISSRKEDTDIQTYTSKDMNLIIKNTGTIPLKLYSIFPGNENKKLIELDDNYAHILNSKPYERVPILIEGESPNSQRANDTANYQTLGQILYFKETSIYNIGSYYKDSGAEYKDLYSKWNAMSNQVNPAQMIETLYSSMFQNYYQLSQYIGTNQQLAMPLRYRLENYMTSTNQVFSNLTFTLDNNQVTGMNILTKDTLDYDNRNSFRDFVNNAYTNIIDFDRYKYNEMDSDDRLSNTFILRYEHIFGKDENNETVQLNNKIVLASSLNNYTFYKINTKGQFEPISVNDLYGGFFIPTLKYKKQIICTEDNGSYTSVGVGDKIVIPLTFQYFLDASDEHKEITKILSFDIKKSLMKDPENFVITLTAKYDQTLTATEISSININLIDEVQ